MVNVTTSEFGLTSSGVAMFGVGIININVTQIERQYATSDGHWENFTIQHIVNHEFMHPVTGLPDGELHNRLTNEVNKQTQAGPPRLDYNTVRCFIAGTPIRMADGSEKPIEDVQVGDWVLSFDKNGRYLPGQVSKTFQNMTTVFIDLHGLKVTPGHRFHVGDDRYETISDILLRDGFVVHVEKGRVRARTNIPLGSFGDRPVEVVFVDRLTGLPRAATVRGGIPCVRSIDDTLLTLAYVIGRAGGEILPDGSVEKDGACGPAVWPAGTPLDTHYQRNFVMSLDGLPYVPEWIAGLNDPKATHGLGQVFGSEAGAFVYRHASVGGGSAIREPSLAYNSPAAEYALSSQRASVATLPLNRRARRKQAAIQRLH